MQKRSKIEELKGTKMRSTTQVKLDFWVTHNKNVLFVGRHGTGKCLGLGTPVILYSGKTVPVEQIKVGDQLMGPDSTPRNVIGLTRGVDEMYKIIPTKGESFTCNSAHILSLKMAGKDKIIDISVKNYLNSSKRFKRRSMLFRSEVSFNNYKELEIPPYILGLWLGDGHTSGTAITNTDIEIVDEICDFANDNSLLVKERGNLSYDVTSGTKKGSRLRNTFRNALRKYNLLDNKHIPYQFLFSNKENRLKLLAGLLDSNGHLTNNCYDIIQKSLKLSKDILFLARSLGFAAYMNPCIKACMYKGEKKCGRYYRISISGDVSIIPCKLSRKIGTKRRQIKNVLKTGIKKIISLGKDDYYGFSLDGDQRFLLGDFTVTHNSSIVIDTFNRHKLNYLYFSAATMDPWVDFVGVPREKNDDKLPKEFKVIKELALIDPDLATEWIKNNWSMTTESANKIINHTTNKIVGASYLELIRPQAFATDTVEAIFFDEFNRSPKKVRNAVMELLQFKSINGKKFPNLKIIWAAINPDDDDQNYDVEKLDPAQADRFHITVGIEYKPNKDWFKERYTAKIAESAISWWEELPDELKNLVSPRRLQYAIDVYTERGDIRDVLPETSNTQKLRDALNNGPISDKLEQFIKSGNVTEAREFMKNENNYTAAMKYITKSQSLMDYFFPLLPKEKINVIMSENDDCCNYIINNSDKIPIFKSACKEIINTNTNTRLVKKIKRYLTENQQLAVSFSKDDNDPEPPFFNKNASFTPNLDQEIKLLNNLASQEKNIAKKNEILEKLKVIIPEKINANEALTCLELLGQFNVNNTVLGIANHCIMRINETTGLKWEEMCRKHGTHFKVLIEKIKGLNLLNKVFMP